jgi:DNA mismatch repair ATPase MutL
MEEKSLLPETYEGEPFEVENIFVQVLQEERQTLNKLGWEYEIGERGPIFTKVRLMSVPSSYGRRCRENEFHEVLDSYFERSMQEVSKSQK